MEYAFAEEPSFTLMPMPVPLPEGPYASSLMKRTVGALLRAGGVSMGRSVLRWGVASALTVCLLSALGQAAVAQEITDNEGGLTVTPRRGPIGTTVTLRGNGCTFISFIGGDLGGVTGGFDSLPDIKLDGGGDFEVTYKIPARLEPYMGLSGGRPKPGTYFFRSFPPRCYAEFVVTGLARTGPERIPLAAIAVLGGLLVAIGSAMVATARWDRAEPPIAP